MKKHKSGFVTIVGNPNVGKSTLMNAWVGERLSIITSKAQTTRHRILGIINGDDYQMVLSDTPGVIKPSYEMQSSMMDFVKIALDDADILIYMVEIGEKEMKDTAFFEKIKGSKIPLLLLINKIDNADQDILMTTIAFWKEMLPMAEVFPISAITGFSVKEVLDYIIEKGADLDQNTTEHFRETPLTLAISKHHFELVKRLLDVGADPNFRNGVELTPLEICALRSKEHKIDIGVLLLKNGADMLIKNKNKRTILSTYDFEKDFATTIKLAIDKG